MGRPQRTTSEIEAKKENILEVALDVLDDDGYLSLSINKVAGKLGMTSANLYNYFVNKDELNMAMQTRIAKRIYEAYKVDYDTYDDPLKRLEAFNQTLVDLGRKHPNHYDILYSITAPRSKDFIGTSVEKAALVEKEKARQIAVNHREITMKVALEIYQRYQSFEPEEASFLLNSMWCTLHGAITLYNRNFLLRFGDSNEEMFAKICTDVLAPFRHRGN